MEVILEDIFTKVEYPKLDVVAEDILPLDAFERNVFAGNIARLIKSGNMTPPYVFGIYGEWGTGKSWVMSQLRFLLEQSGYKTCWFEAWRYENESSLFYPLCRAIEKCAGGEVLEIDPTSKAQLQFIFASRRELLAKAAQAMAWGSVLSGLLGFLFRFRKKVLEEWVDAVSRGQEIFGKFISAAQGGSDKPLVVCVDDLDRCSSDSVIHLLEDIKHLTSSSSWKQPVIFILALDQGALLSAIQNKYGRQANLLWTQSYLQKIVRYNVELPELEFSRLKSFIYEQERMFSLSFGEDFIDTLAKMCISGRLHNIRKLLLVFQKFHFIDEIYKTKNNGYGPLKARIFFYLLLKEHWPDFHNAIMRNNDLFYNFFSHASVHSLMDRKNGIQANPVLLDAEAYCKDEDLVWFFRRFGEKFSIIKPEINKIIRYVLLIEGVGVQG